MNSMRWYIWIVLVVFACVLGAGRMSTRIQNTAITVLSDDLDSFTPVNVGSVDFYTADFQLEIPHQQDI